MAPAQNKNGYQTRLALLHVEVRLLDPLEVLVKVTLVMNTLQDNLRSVQARINAACASCGRNPSEVTLLAVSKTFGADAVQEVAACGQQDFGENYIQEGVDKITFYKVQLM